jgi:hypothetical protein
MQTDLQRFLKHTTALATALAVIAVFGFAVTEPATSVAQSDSSTFDANLTVDEEISLTVTGTPISMDNLGITSGDLTDGKATLNVETNSKDGYTLAVKASSSPALQHDSTSDTFEDYTPATANTAESWSADSNSYQFGYGAYGSDATSEFTNSGNCTDSDPTSGSEKYEGFATTSENIAENSTTTSTGGVDTTFCVAAEQNGVYAPSGNYTATIVATAAVK